ncbi:MAG: hypothetical protein GXN91_02530, partial [Epsilonproteobacteria bacterium]|nr:hypothetical protein [Campylobacterota bacterium]
SNKNGIQDEGEVGVANVKVTLNETNATTITDSSGRYEFCGLNEGNYSITIETPEGYMITLKNQGGDDSIDSDLNSDGSSDKVTIKGDNNYTLDGGVYKTTAILGDRVWLDINGNGIQDDNESGVSGVVVYLLDANGSRVKDSSGKDISSISDENGEYRFEVEPGEYMVEVDSDSIGVGYKLTIKDALNNSVDDKDSDIDPQTYRSDIVKLEAATEYRDLDIGLVRIEGEIDIEKLTNGADADRADGSDVPLVLVGQEVEWRYIITNRSSESLVDIRVEDDKEGVISCPKVELAPNESMECIKKGVAKEGDYENRAIVSAKGKESGSEVSDEDLSHYRGVNGVSIGDFVWEDINRNGVQDEKEVGIGGVEVILFMKKDDEWVEAVDIDGNRVEKVTTTSDGKYIFENLKPNETYKIKFEIGDEFYPTLKDVADDAVDSDVDENKEIVVEVNTTNLNLDGGFYRKGEIGDYIWEDRNANGIQDEEEAGIGGVEVILLNENGEELQRVLTNEEGLYLFKGLEPATYQVKIITPEGYFVTRENVGDDERDSDLEEFLAQGEVKMPKELIESNESNRSLDGGMFKPVCLGDYVWLDENGNGIQDEGEKPLEGVSVKLIPLEDEFGNINTIDVYKQPIVDKIIATDSNGHYEFCGLIPGRYKVAFKTDEPYLSTKAVDSSDEIDSDIEPFKNASEEWVESEPIDLSLSNKPVLDAGFIESLCVGDFVWYEEEVNGRYDEGEPGVIGIEVRLLTLDNQIAKDIFGNDILPVKTNSNGEYSFCNLKPGGDYKIKFILPDTYHPTIQNGVADDEIDSDANSEGEIIVNNLQRVEDSKYQGIKDGKPGNYTLDVGIYCDCEDYEINPTKSSASFNLISSLFFLLLLLSLFRRV